MKMFYLLTFLIPLSANSQTLYKCTTEENVTIYSEVPCKKNTSKKVTIKDNTLDQTELRKSTLYTQALPKPIQEQTSSSVSVINQKEQATTTRSSLASESTGSNISDGSSGGTPAVTTQPWK